MYTNKIQIQYDMKSGVWVASTRIAGELEVEIGSSVEIVLYRMCESLVNKLNNSDRKVSEILDK